MAVIKLPSINRPAESGVDQQLKVAQADLMQTQKGLAAVKTALLAAELGDAVVESKPLNMLVDEVKLRGGQLADWVSGKEQPEHTGKAALERRRGPLQTNFVPPPDKGDRERAAGIAFDEAKGRMAQAAADMPARAPAPEPERPMNEKALEALGWMREQGARINRDRTAAGARERTPAQVARDKKVAEFGGYATRTDPRGSNWHLSDFAKEALLANADPDALAVVRSLGITLPQLIERVDQPLEKWGSSEGSIDLLDAIVPGVRRRMEMGASAKDAVGHIAAQRYQARAQAQGEHDKNEMLLGAVDDMGELGGYLAENLRRGFSKMFDGDEALADESLSIIKETGAAPTAESIGAAKAQQILPAIGETPDPSKALRGGAAGSAERALTEFVGQQPMPGVGRGGVPQVVDDMVGRAATAAGGGRRIVLPKSADVRQQEVLAVAAQLESQEYMPMPSVEQLEQSTVNQLIGIAASTPLTNEEFAMLDYLVKEKARSQGLSNIAGNKYITDARDLLAKARQGFLAENRAAKRLKMAKDLAKIHKDLAQGNRADTAAQTDWIRTSIESELTEAKTTNEWLRFLANPRNKRALLGSRLRSKGIRNKRVHLLASQYRFDMPRASTELGKQIGDDDNILIASQTVPNARIVAELNSLVTSGTKSERIAAAAALEGIAVQFKTEAAMQRATAATSLSNQKVEALEAEMRAAKRNAAIARQVAPLEAKLATAVENRKSAQETKTDFGKGTQGWVESPGYRAAVAAEKKFQKEVESLRKKIAEIKSGLVAPRDDGGKGREVPADTQPGADDF